MSLQKEACNTRPGASVEMNSFSMKKGLTENTDGGGGDGLADGEPDAGHGRARASGGGPALGLGRLIVLDLGPAGPAAQVGWTAQGR